MASRSRSLAQLERDAALARVSRLRRWTIAGAAALTAGIAALVSSVAPGHTLRSRRLAQARSVARAAPTTSALRMPPLASASDLGLQGPPSNPGSVSPAASAPPASNPAPSDPAPSSSAPAPSPTPAPAPSSSGAVSGGS